MNECGFYEPWKYRKLTHTMIKIPTLIPTHLDPAITFPWRSKLLSCSFCFSLMLLIICCVFWFFSFRSWRRWRISPLSDSAALTRFKLNFTCPKKNYTPHKMTYKYEWKRSTTWNINILLKKIATNLGMISSVCFRRLFGSHSLPDASSTMESLSTGSSSVSEAVDVSSSSRGRLEGTRGRGGS